MFAESNQLRVQREVVYLHGLFYLD